METRLISLPEFCLVTALLLAAAFPTWAGETPEVLSPAVRQALNDLSDETFVTRERSLRRVQLALGQQLEAFIASDDSEAQLRIAALLEFNDGITRWAIETFTLSDAQRKAQLRWGLSPDLLPILARVFSPASDKRLESLKQLAKLDDVEASVPLAELLNDPDRAVYVAAMEAVWDRKPTDAIVNSLWNRAVDAGFAGSSSQRLDHGDNIVFRGRALSGAVRAGFPGSQMQDHQLAVEVLIHLRSPQVTDKLGTLFAKIDQEIAGENINNMYLTLNDPMKNAYLIAEAYRPKEIVPMLYHLAIGRITNRAQLLDQMINERRFYSNRVTPLALFVLITEQSLEEYKLRKLTTAGELWTVPTEADENDAVEKIKSWWQKHAQEYGTPRVDPSVPRP